MARQGYNAVLITVIRTELTFKGTGESANDPKRRVIQYWSTTGELLAEVDTWAGPEVALASPRREDEQTRADDAAWQRERAVHARAAKITSAERGVLRAAERWAKCHDSQPCYVSRIGEYDGILADACKRLSAARGGR